MQHMRKWRGNFTLHASQFLFQPLPDSAVRGNYPDDSPIQFMLSFVMCYEQLLLFIWRHSHILHFCVKYNMDNIKLTVLN